MVRKAKCVSFSPILFGMVEEWRKEQKEIPSFSKAVETLINKGLEKELMYKERT